MDKNTSLVSTKLWFSPVFSLSLSVYVLLHNKDFSAESGQISELFTISRLRLVSFISKMLRSKSRAERGFGVFGAEGGGEIGIRGTTASRTTYAECCHPPFACSFILSLSYSLMYDNQ